MLMNNNLDEIIEELVERLDDVLEYFGLEYTLYPDRYSMGCPIHGSDNDESLSIFIDGHTTSGNWRCWSMECENEIVEDHDKEGNVLSRPRGKSLLGLIRSLLAVKHDRHVEYGEAIRWAKSFLNHQENETDTPQSIDVASKKLFVKESNILLKERRVSTGNITRPQIRSKLTIPSSYFLGRDFAKDVLDRYDVGFCSAPKTQMYNRVVVPIYDDKHEYMLGCIGRTIQPKCNVCGKYHYLDRRCPSNKLEKYWASKWIHSKGFSSESTFYNLWFARQHILDCGVAILVEGQPDVWRLEEAGIKIGLGIFGTSLSEGQKITLDESGAMTLIILTDSDKPGLEAREKIRKKCERAYNCIFVDLPKKDIGDMKAEQVKQLLGPVLERVL